VVQAKSSLTAALAAFLASKKTEVAIIDLNFDQATLTNWWRQRGQPDLPHLVEISKKFTFAQAMQSLRDAKCAYCILDTSPVDTEIIVAAINEADSTIIPVRPSDLDISACRTVADACRRRRKPFAFLLAQADTRPTFKKINEAAMARLREMGDVLKTLLPMNKAYLGALTDTAHRGKTGHEIDKTLAPTIAAMWAEIECVGVPVPLRWKSK
jgi:chromosome partitioning protein